MIRSYFLALLVLFGIYAQSVQAVDEAFITTDNTSPLIGEPVNLVLHIHIPLHAQIILPDFAGEWAGITVNQIGSLNVVDQLENGTVDYELPLTIILWRTGQVTPPPITVSYQIEDLAPVTLSVNNVEFFVPSVLDSNDLSLRPLKQQLSIPYFPRWGIAAALLFVVGIIVFGFVGRRRKWAPINLNSQLESNLHYAAAAALTTLQQTGGTEPNPVVIYQKVSDSLRHYLDKRMMSQSLDLTTNELAARLKKEDHITEMHQRQLYDMLKLADMVKFSQVTPKIKSAHQFVSTAAEWIQAVEDQPQL